MSPNSKPAAGDKEAFRHQNSRDNARRTRQRGAFRRAVRDHRGARAPAGWAIVYRAYDKEVGEEIALKLLHPEIALDQKTVERFRNEIKLARKITHKNVCRMHELHQDGKSSSSRWSTCRAGP